MLSARVIATSQEFKDLRSAWDQLLEKCPVNEIFMTFDWLHTWWHHIGNEHELRIIAVYDHKKLVGIAPLMLMHSGTSRATIRFIGHPDVDYSDFIIPERHEAVLGIMLEFLQKNHDAWHALDFTEIPEGSPTLAWLPSLVVEAGLHASLYVSNPTLSLDCSLPAELIKSRLKKRSLNRHLKYLQQSGVFEYKRITQQKDIEAALPIFFKQHQAIWHRKQESSFFDYQKYRAFFTALAETLVPLHKCEPWGMYLNGNLISFEFGFVHQKKFIAYCQSYDLAYEKQSLGTMLHKLFTEYYYEAGFREVDYSRGIEPFKERFATTRSHNRGMVIHQSKLAYVINASYLSFRHHIMEHHGLHMKLVKARSLFAAVHLKVTTLLWSVIFSGKNTTPKYNKWLR